MKASLVSITVGIVFIVGCGEGKREPVSMSTESTYSDSIVTLTAELREENKRAAEAARLDEVQSERDYLSGVSARLGMFASELGELEVPDDASKDHQELRDAAMRLADAVTGALHPSTQGVEEIAAISDAHELLKAACLKLLERHAQGDVNNCDLGLTPEA